MPRLRKVVLNGVTYMLSDDDSWGEETQRDTVRPPMSGSGVRMRPGSRKIKRVANER